MVVFAVVVKNEDFPLGLCYTNGPITDGSVWQIYGTKEEALEFCSLPFKDAQYEIVEVNIQAA
jgi:hypothetical protein